MEIKVTLTKEDLLELLKTRYLSFTLEKIQKEVEEEEEENATTLS